jgi:hypothetical protein
LTEGKALITAALKTFVQPHVDQFVDDPEGVMHESPRNPDWSNDLGTGKGVFMRLVTRFAHQHRFFNDQEFEKAFRRFVESTAKSAWCSRKIPEVGDKTKWEIAPNWNPGFGPPEEGQQPTSYDANPGLLLWPQVLQTNGLDALNAAVQLGA